MQNKPTDYDSRQQTYSSESDKAKARVLHAENVEYDRVKQGATDVPMVFGPTRLQRLFSYFSNRGYIKSLEAANKQLTENLESAKRQMAIITENEQERLRLCQLMRDLFHFLNEHYPQELQRAQTFNTPIPVLVQQILLDVKKGGK